MCSYLRMFVFAVVFMGVDCFSLGQTDGQKCGVEASSNLAHHNPWLVFLEYLRNGRLTRTRCGGTLIDSRHVVTAAHCVKSSFDALKARLGEYDIEAKQECVQGVCTDRIVSIEVEDIIVHPEYDGKEHDIAILRLKEDAPYTDFIRPACLPTGQLQDVATFIAAGWGIIPHRGEFSHIKKIVPLPYFKTEACQEVYGAKNVPKSVICAGGEPNIDMCSGDSGGPLVWMKERAELWGVTSSGSIHCGTAGIPGIYTKVVDYLDWIQTVISVTKM